MNNLTYQKQKNQVSSKKNKQQVYALSKPLFSNALKNNDKSWRGGLSQLREGSLPAPYTYKALQIEKKCRIMYNMQTELNSALYSQKDDYLDISNSDCNILDHLVTKKDYDKVLEFINSEPYPTSPNIIGEIFAYGDKKIAVLNAIIYLTSKYNVTYTSDQKIADLINERYTYWKKPICRQTVNKIKKELKNSGLIDYMKIPGYNKPCLYKISHFFVQNRVEDVTHARILEKKLWALKTQTVKHKLQQVKNKLATLCINEEEYIYKHTQQRVTNITISTVCKRDYQKEDKEKGNSMTILDKIANEFEFGNHEVNELKKFSNEIVKLAYQAMKKKSQHEKIGNAFRFLVAACKILHEKQTNNGVIAESRVISVVENKPEPEWVKDYRENKIPDDTLSVDDMLTEQENLNKKIKNYQAYIELAKKRFANSNQPDLADLRKIDEYLKSLNKAKQRYTQLSVLLGDKSKPLNDTEHKQAKRTVLDIANGITVFTSEENLQKIRTTAPQHGEELREKALINWLSRDFEYNENDSTHRIALILVNKWRKKYNLLPKFEKPAANQTKAMEIPLNGNDLDSKTMTELDNMHSYIANAFS